MFVASGRETRTCKTAVFSFADAALRWGGWVGRGDGYRSLNLHTWSSWSMLDHGWFWMTLAHGRNEANIPESLCSHHGDVHPQLLQYARQWQWRWENSRCAANLAQATAQSFRWEKDSQTWSSKPTYKVVASSGGMTLGQQEFSTIVTKVTKERKSK